MHWLQTGDGLEFGNAVKAVSRCFFGRGIKTTRPGPEIALKAARSQNGGTILFVCSVGPSGEPFSLRQFGNSLVVRGQYRCQPPSRTALISVPGLFQGSLQPLFLTFALNAQGMSIYVNGILTCVSPLSGTRNDLTGRLVLANSPTAHNSWQGEITRVAIHGQELTAGQIADRYSGWKENRNRHLGPAKHPLRSIS